MKANLNAVLTIVTDPQSSKRGIRIEWCRYNNSIARGQVVWDDEGMWKGVPEKLDIFLESFTGKEGYNGRAYSGQWMFDFLATKDVKYPDLADHVREARHPRRSAVV